MSQSFRHRQVRRRVVPIRAIKRPGRFDSPRFRLILVWGVLFVTALSLGVNLVRLQVLDAGELRQKAIAQQQVQQAGSGSRRLISDRHGQVLAIDRPAYTLYAHPKLFTQPLAEVAQALATLTGRPIGELLSLLQTGESGIEIEYTLQEDTARRIRQQGIDGLELVEKRQRFYPQENLFAEVVGFLNLEGQPQQGVEVFYDNLLQDTAQTLQVRRTGDGLVLPDGLSARFFHESELQLELTLDSRLQRVVRTVLKQQMQNFKAKRGTVIVMDAQNGEILSLVTEPSFDANTYYKSKVEVLKNWAVTDLYEPGSTFKPLNVAIALEAGVIQPNSYIYDSGQITVSNETIQNSDFETMGSGRGSISVGEVIQYSSNVGMVRIMEQMTPNAFYDQLKKLGISQSTGIDIPSEAIGQMPSRETFASARVYPATHAFGQGFTLTPIQLAQLHAALANGGYLVKPRVVRGLYDRQGQPHWQPRTQRQRLFSAKTTQAVLEMMEESVVNGTGQASAIPNYRIAGKTGTAQKALPQGGYSETARITSFVGILPVAPVDQTHPHRYVVLAVVDEPEGENAYGGTVAAPMVKPILEALITLEGIPSAKATPEP